MKPPPATDIAKHPGATQIVSEAEEPVNIPPVATTSPEPSTIVYSFPFHPSPQESFMYITIPVKPDESH